MSYKPPFYILDLQPPYRINMEKKGYNGLNKEGMYRDKNVVILCGLIRFGADFVRDMRCLFPSRTIYAVHVLPNTVNDSKC